MNYGKFKSEPYGASCLMVLTLRLCAEIIMWQPTGSMLL
jgi:hypothetical protein